jgi:microcystin-dependent protein
MPLFASAMRMLQLAVTPATPEAGAQSLYPKADGNYYVLDASGVERPLVPLPDSLHLNAGFDGTAASTSGGFCQTGGVASRPVPNNWGFSYCNGTPNYTSDSVTTVDGTGASVSTILKVGDAQWIASSNFAASAGSVVTLSIWARTSSTAAGGPRLSFGFMSAVGPPTVLDSATHMQTQILSLTTAWQKFNVSFVVPGSDDTGAVAMLMDGNWAGVSRGGTLWADKSSSSIQTAPASTVPVGTVSMYAGSVAPAGYLICDGSAVAQATYPGLYALIGTTYGPAASGNFTLPDLRGRFPLGVGTSQPSGTARALGVTAGADQVTIGGTNLPAHTHSLDVGGGTAGVANAVVQRSTGSVVATITAPVGSGPGTSAPLANLPPSLSLNYLIKT